jgi:hypothetical protein
MQAKWMSLVLVLIVGCSNAETPQGSEGYVRQGAWVGSARFYSAQVGPTSTGLGWLLSAENIDMRWRTINEDFAVMSADNLSLSFHAHLVCRPKQGTVKEIVEVYGGQEWYERNLREPFRNAVYEAVAGQRALEAKDRREEIGDKVTAKFVEYVQGKPFEVQIITIGTIDLPQSVAVAQEAKIAKQTELERKDFEIRIAAKEAETRVAEARGLAEAQRIINETLTPRYLQYEAIKAQIAMANSPNHTTVYIPSGENGIPIVRTTE